MIYSQRSHFLDCCYFSKRISVGYIRVHQQKKMHNNAILLEQESDVATFGVFVDQQCKHNTKQLNNQTGKTSLGSNTKLSKKLSRQENLTGNSHQCCISYDNQFSNWLLTLVIRHVYFSLPGMTCQGDTMSTCKFVMHYS